MELQDLPEGCIAKILSYTTPVDACRLSVSIAFRSAAKSDTVWDCFLLSDFTSFIPPSSTSKNDLYFTLSDLPTIMDQGRKSVQLAKGPGRSVTCFPLEIWPLYGVILFDIGSGQACQSPTRFQEVAMLRAVCWFDISGSINTLTLSSNTHYSASLVFKMINPSGFHYHPTVLSVGIFGGNSNTKYVCLDPNLKGNHRFQELQCPKVRSDGWLEI
ncbi:F-box protein PP2-B10-like isoform X1 [Glycine soja]|uniref:F-box protein PP2-B10 n=1 Tax=Glycine soja TaxID=3848 RepID=A0A445GBM3_GLYSO|nr:F-box protein PP2-B10-like isoform X1 [Glycine soja]RZB58613.1 F-box protein PP2-B10 [Glycine soja]